MKKTIDIITHRCGMAVFYQRIFQELFGDCAEIYAGAMEDGSIGQLPGADLYVSSVTSYDVLQDSSVREYIGEKIHPIRMDVTFQQAAVDLLQTYPEGTKALLINQNKHMVMECIAQLYHLGISNIEFYPCYPGIERLPEIPLAFTVGEPDLVPEGLPHAVDIGSRLPTANVICEVALKLGNAFFLEGGRFKRYRNRLANVDYSLQTISLHHLTAENRLEIILNSLDEGIICTDERGMVTLINKPARQILHVSRAEVVGRPASEVFPDLLSGWEEPCLDGPRLLNIQGVDIGVSLVPLRLEGRLLGSFLTLKDFRDSERLQNSLRLQKSRKIHKASHHFADIVGAGPAISKVKALARRMASNEAAVLLQGENGVGKTVFAQAIHNASDRSGGAFVTVSCAALRDELLEVELFGRADTERTIRTGGRVGLIECAHKGTLFLDSIEYMSPGLQARLLRMLKEKEMTRVGDDEPIPVDIRVIASANEDILKKVREGSFRRDLYYRLNVIPIAIPPLRERRTDISALIDYFRIKMDAEYELTTQAKRALIQYRWEGNVRELKNCVEYLKYTGLRTIHYEDLPKAIRDARAQAKRREELDRLGNVTIQEFWVLRELAERYRDHKGTGRQTIAERCVMQGNVISEYEVRAALDKLSEMGYVDIRSGRGGSRLTEQGYLQYRRILYDEWSE